MMAVPSSTDILSLRTAIRDLIRVLGGGQLAKLTDAINRLCDVIGDEVKEEKADPKQMEAIILLTSIETQLKVMAEGLAKQDKGSVIVRKTQK